MAKLAYLNDDFHVKVCTVVISFFLRFLLTDCCPEKHNTERVIFSLKMPHLLSAYYEIVTLNKKKTYKYIDYHSLLNTSTFIFMYIVVKTMKSWIHFCPVGWIQPNLVSLNYPCHLNDGSIKSINKNLTISCEPSQLGQKAPSIHALLFVNYSHLILYCQI